MSSSAPRVLVVSGSAGHGHTMAGRALTAALRARHPQVETRHVDAVAMMNPLFKHFYRWAYIRLVDRHPILWRKLYEVTDVSTSAATHAVTVLAGAGFLRYVGRLAPDLVVCTHFLAPELLGRALRKERLRTRLHAVITDHDTHRSWYYPEVERYYVASDLVRARLALTYGVPEDRIDVTGIPVREEFAQRAEPGPVRVRHGLDAGRPTVLFLSGGFHAGPMREAILGLWRDRRDIQVIAVCGRNERLRRLVARMPRPSGAVLLALGFTDEVRGLMEVADVVVSKSGGMSTSECMAVGRPMLISGSIPGQEERNADAVVEAGAGFRAFTPAEVRWRTMALLEDRDLRATVARRALHMGRPQAAAAIADRIAAVLHAQAPVSGPRFHGAV